MRLHGRLGPAGAAPREVLEHASNREPRDLKKGKRKIMHRSWLSQGLRTVACLTALILAGGSELAAQEAYPTRTVTIVVPYTAGGGVDSVARLVGEDMRASLGQAVIVENVPGASGMIGAQRVARAD